MYEPDVTAVVAKSTVGAVAVPPIEMRDVLADVTDATFEVAVSYAVLTELGVAAVVTLVDATLSVS